MGEQKANYTIVNNVSRDFHEERVYGRNKKRSYRAMAAAIGSALEEKHNRQTGDGYQGGYADETVERATGEMQ